MDRQDGCPDEPTREELDEWNASIEVLYALHQSVGKVFGVDDPLFQALKAGLTLGKPGDSWATRFATVQNALAAWYKEDESIRRRVLLERKLYGGRRQ
jgi:hypothetical protein